MTLTLALYLLAMMWIARLRIGGLLLTFLFWLDGGEHVANYVVYLTLLPGALRH